ncbi:hypothetical protein [Massilibacteroides sp.]|uniref:hypothetical protein n=1 Tax=Massilibacteroides sp. TaxID=2034766 RepID=UPI00262C7C9C|nr:hypothetical protein [Massilibacteroides sp.]MDD4515384.1 hypothetical protein [Massilibacteroides sp.]
MKNSAGQLTRAYINDNKQFIEGNIAEHLMLNLEAVSCYNEYLSDEEIEEYENASMERKAEIEAEIENWINYNFNFDISKFEY